MLVINIHNIRVYGKTVSKISEVIGYKPNYGFISVSSSILLECGTSKTNVIVKCNKCGSENNTKTCVIFRNPERLNLCVKCTKSKAQLKFKATAAGKLAIKQSIETRINSDSWRKSREIASAKYRKWYSELPEETKEEKRIASRKNLIRFGDENGKWNPLKDEFKKYRQIVRTYTYRNKKIYSKWDNYDKIGKSGIDGAYQLDHIISIKRGFDENICPSIIGDINNLQIIPWEDNRSKWY